MRKCIPITSSGDGRRFFQRVDGKLFATPLLVTLAFIETTDIIFAIDSVPAIFAITREPLIVFTSNVFAILGLRSMYFLLAGAVAGFICCVTAWHGHFPMAISLSVIGGVLAASIGLSLAFPKSAAAGRGPAPRHAANN